MWVSKKIRLNYDNYVRCVTYGMGWKFRGASLHKPLILDGFQSKTKKI